MLQHGCYYDLILFVIDLGIIDEVGAVKLKHMPELKLLSVMKDESYLTAIVFTTLEWTKSGSLVQHTISHNVLSAAKVPYDVHFTSS